jgi:hypothetical protein
MVYIVHKHIVGLLGIEPLLGFFKSTLTFKTFKVSQIFTCGLSDLLLLAVGSLVVFVLREYILKVHILVSSEHKLCRIWNTCIVSCIYTIIVQVRYIIIETKEAARLRPSHEYSCWKRNSLYPIRANSLPTPWKGLQFEGLAFKNDLVVSVTFTLYCSHVRDAIF